MAESSDNPVTWLNRFEAFSEKWMRVAEIWAVLVLITIIWISAVGTAVWIAFYPTVRLPQVMGNLNNNWRACLLLLTPLFYRTIRVVLERMKKFPFGMEVQEPEEQVSARTPPSKPEQTPEDDS